MYDHTRHCGRKHFCCYCWQDFSSREILKCHINDYFKINGKQTIKMSKKGEYIRFKNYERKIKSLFISYVDFKLILVKQMDQKKYMNFSMNNNLAFIYSFQFQSSSLESLVKNL